MHHSKVIWRSASPTPPYLHALDGNISPSGLDNGSLEPSKKRRKITKTSEQTCMDLDKLRDGYLCLTRVDIQLIFAGQKGIRETPPSRSSSPRPVLLQRVEKAQNSVNAFVCQVARASGDLLMDKTVSGECSSQTLEVLQRIVDIPRVSLKRTAARVVCTMSRQTDGGNIPGTSFSLCAKILLPNNQELLEGSAFDRQLVLDLCGVDVPAGIDRPWSRDFYDSAFVPNKSSLSSSFPRIDKLKCQLYPFQQRAIGWLLQREGESNKSDESTTADLPHGFVQTVDADGNPCFISPFLGTMTSNEDLIQGFSEIKGGILAEEMGLGKTVEMIAQPRGCAATLIITPLSILGQWKSELQSLAPDLRVTTYEGLRAQDTNDLETYVSKFRDHDVVLTAYNVLAREIHHSGHVPDRTFRNQKKYERRLSPLTQLKWWRVVLDEAQMIESGVSNAAKVAQLIPRHNAWCVSGTPVKKNSQDLRGLLVFLRFPPYCYSAPLWDRLVEQRRDIFRQIFKHLTLRHTKEHIKDDIQLPPQSRVIITVPFTQIEEQNYVTLYNQMCQECGLDGDGNPFSEDWDPNASSTVEKMRSWLLRLRQTCLHAEVGIRNRKALGNGKNPLRTVNEVLEVMTEQNLTALRSEERALLVSKTRRGQIVEHAKQSKDALKIWSEALKESQSIVSEARLRLQADRIEGKSGDADAPINAPRQRLRSALELEHMLLFFTANAYYQLKSNESKPESEEFQKLERQEEEHYEKAKTIRKEILVEARNKVDPLMKMLHDKTREKSFAKIPDLKVPANRGGIESRSVSEKLEDVTRIINRQASRIDEWRGKAIRLLSMSLVDEEDTDLQGDEYETSTQQQDTVYSYVDALRAVVSDFHDIITGQRNMLIEHDVKVALQQAIAGGGHSPDLLKELLSIRDKLKPPAGTGSVRGIITDLREIRTPLRAQVEKGNVRAGAELGIVNTVLTTIQSLSAILSKAAAALQREVELFTDVMNARLEYYRQLQQISDTVAPYEEDLEGGAFSTALSRAEQVEARLHSKIATLKSTARYLDHVRREASDGDVNRLCIICQQNFEIGVLTSCGHSYCVDCLRLWRHHHGTCPTCKKRLDQNDLHQITYKPQELTVREETQARDRTEATPSDEGNPSTSIYTGISASTLNEIKNTNMDVKQSFGTKVDSIARHIIWLRENDPGSKAVVFSQFRDFLSVLGTAFTSFKIGYARIDQKTGVQRFKDDPGIECLLMDAKTNSSGLTLVNATHVFLCQPLINTAIELQAVARVHRIGQNQPTTVWVYVVEDTVEKSIYEISVERRMAHIGEPDLQKASSKTGQNDGIEGQIEAANTLELEAAPLGKLLSSGASGGEVVDKKDLWSCLFRQKPVQAEPMSPTIGRHLRAAAAEERRAEDD